MKKQILLLWLFLSPLIAFSQVVMEFGDAPEGVIAYPPTGMMGSFPTCINVGPAGFVMHNNFGAFFLAFDFEPDGNAGICPAFAPYDLDECFGDGDAGLIMPDAYTIVNNVIVLCPQSAGVSLDSTCTLMYWGSDIDIQVTNFMPSQWTGFVNVLIDWNQNGVWGDVLTCPSGPCPEHVLVNHPVMNGFTGPLSLTGPPPFLSGPMIGFFWARFSITEQPVPQNWLGYGTFEDGESEDYLLYMGHYDYGDAPEGSVAYPAAGTLGNFPTCMNVGSTINSYISHAAGNSWFGPVVDQETEGNQGFCPAFTPNQYDRDECFADNDAGLIIPGAYTIIGPAGQEVVAPCGTGATPMDTVCKYAQWGTDVDIIVNGTGYVNVLMDWNQDGNWWTDTTVKCNGVVVPENVLVDFFVQGATGVPLSSLFPPAFLVGPNDGYVWTRFTITPVMLGPSWTGTGTYSDGETEDYLLEIADDATSINLIQPNVRTPLKVTPNPVKDQFNIEYALASEGMVLLELIGPEGRILDVLDQGLKAQGTHHVSVDAAALPYKLNSGFFFIRLTVNEKPAVFEKVVVAR